MGAAQPAYEGAEHELVVLVDAERGFHMFGSSGALTATVLTGLALRALAGRAAPARATLAG